MAHGRISMSKYIYFHSSLISYMHVCVCILHAVMAGN